MVTSAHMALTRNHYASKRTMPGGYPIVTAIVVVIVVFNIVISLAWFLVCRGRSNLPKKRTSLSRFVEDRESRRTSIAATSAILAPQRAPFQAQPMSYVQMMHSLQRSQADRHSAHPPRGASADRDVIGNLSPVSRPPAVKYIKASRTRNFQLMATAGNMSTMRISQHPVLPTKSIGGDTASIYSSASAPLEYHDHLFRTRPFALDRTTPVNRPVWNVPKPCLPADGTPTRPGDVPVLHESTSSLSTRSRDSISMARAPLPFSSFSGLASSSDTACSSSSLTNPPRGKIEIGPYSAPPISRLSSISAHATQPRSVPPPTLVLPPSIRSGPFQSLPPVAPLNIQPRVKEGVVLPAAFTSHVTPLRYNVSEMPVRSSLRPKVVWVQPVAAND